MTVVREMTKSKREQMLTKQKSVQSVVLAVSESRIQIDDHFI